MADLRPIVSIERLVDREGIAEILGTSPGTVDNMRKAGMPSIKWSARWIRFRPSDCIRWLEDHQEAA